MGNIPIAHTNYSFLLTTKSISDMKFSIEKGRQVLERTPFVTKAMLQGLSDEWVLTNEGGDTWSPADVIAHLIYCDRLNWLLRAKHIFKYKDAKPFAPFDRTGGLEVSKSKSLDQLLEEFLRVRKEVLEEIRDLQISEEDIAANGLRPQFGEVTLSQLLSAWVAHDLSHLSQVCRVMAKQFKEEVGPWITYLKLLN